MDYRLRSRLAFTLLLVVIGTLLGAQAAPLEPRQSNGTAQPDLAPSADEPIWPAEPWPIPRNLSFQPGYRTFTELRIRGIRGPQGVFYGSFKSLSAIPLPPPTAVSAAPLMNTKLADSPNFNATIVLLPAMDRANRRIRAATPLLAGAPVVQLNVTIAITRPKLDHSGAVFGVDESFSITIPAKGGASDDDIKIFAQTTLGALRALATLPQLVAGGRVSVPNVGSIRAIRCVKISDRPAKPWRGLMIDVARTYFPIVDLQHIIDAMELVKMNVLHLHLFDSNSFPIQFNWTDGGKLWKLGAFKDNKGQPKLYSAADLRNLGWYAALRGVALLPGLEGPAHADVIARSHPELTACNPNPVTFSGQFNPYAPMLPNFVSSLYSWTLDQAFPRSSGVHVGGDEVEPWCWWDKFPPSTTAWWGEKYDFFKAINQFYAWIGAVVNAPSRPRRHQVIWEDSMIPPWGLANYARKPGTLDKNRTIVQSWREVTKLGWSLARGWQSLFSSEDWWYLDCGEWCTPDAGARSLPTFYKAPVPSSTFLLGGEAVAFSEKFTIDILDRVVWPRAAAVAERLWSEPPQGRWAGLVTQARVNELDRWMRAIGVVGWPPETVMIG